MRRNHGTALTIRYRQCDARFKLSVRKVYCGYCMNNTHETHFEYRTAPTVIHLQSQWGNCRGVVRVSHTKLLVRSTSGRTVTPALEIDRNLGHEYGHRQSGETGTVVISRQSV
jgi:hypothetical protein